MLGRCSLATRSIYGVGAAASAFSNPIFSSITAVTLPCSTQYTHVRHATSKAGGSTKNGRDSQPKFLGVKVYGGQAVQPGDIIVRQRGQKYGIVDSTNTVAFGRDWTIYARQPGFVKFWFHTMQRKYFVEVVRTPSGEGMTAEGYHSKYPIMRVKKWEIPELLKLPADTPITDGVRAQLVEYLKTVHPSHLRSVLPPGKVVVGGVAAEFWGPKKAMDASVDAAVMQ